MAWAGALAPTARAWKSRTPAPVLLMVIVCSCDSPVSRETARDPGEVTIVGAPNVVVEARLESGDALPYSSLALRAK